MESIKSNSKNFRRRAEAIQKKIINPNRVTYSKADVRKILDFYGLMKLTDQIYGQASGKFSEKLRSMSWINPDLDGIPTNYVWDVLNIYQITKLKLTEDVERILKGEQA